MMKDKPTQIQADQDRDHEKDWTREGKRKRGRESESVREKARLREMKSERGWVEQGQLECKSLFKDKTQEKESV